MSEEVNGWRIKKVKRAGIFVYFIIHKGKAVGRAKVHNRMWCAMNTKGDADMMADIGIEITSRTLCEMPMACADAEVSANSEKANRAKQDLRKSVLQ